MSASDDDRISYLADGEAGRLSDDDRREIDALREALSSPASWLQPEGELEDAVVAAVVNAAGARPGSPASRAAGSGPASRAAGGARAPARRGRWLALPRPALTLSFSAALAAVVVAIVLVSSLGGSSSHALRFAMVVRGTPLAPQAHGSATLTKTASGWRIELHARGLPHLQGARYYEAWLKNAAGTLVAVGTFNDARNVTLWSGAPVTVFRRLTVTRQRAGKPVSSGQVVLSGTAR